MELFVEMAYFIRDWWPLVAAFIGLLSAGYRGVVKITDSLRMIRLQLERLTDKLTDYERERDQLRERLDAHDETLDELRMYASRNSDHIAEAEKDIENLYREVKKK